MRIWRHVEATQIKAPTLVLFPSIMRVLTTSSGVVAAEATPPERDPHAAPCSGVVSSPCSA